MFPVEVNGTSTDGEDGICSVDVFTKYPGDQSLSVPS